MFRGEKEKEMGETMVEISAFTLSPQSCFYRTRLMGIAMGAIADDVALQKLMVYPVPMLKGKGLP